MQTDMLKARKTLLSFFFLCMLSCSIPSEILAQEQQHFALATMSTPVFSSPQAASPGQMPEPDRCGQIRQLEFIALPGTVFEIVAPLPDNPLVLQVSTGDYQPRKGVKLFVAQSFLHFHETAPPDRPRTKPSPEVIQKQLHSAVGLPYSWGGNLRKGVMLDGQQRFAGLDCSGLLYEATGGYTPRNTDQLLHFGTAVPIADLRIDEILSRLQPLDLIVWKGHVIIILDQKTVIESVLTCKKEGDGVIITPLKRRMEQVLKQRRPVDNWPHDGKQTALFVIRRWL
jgi:hypothetical protein